jgi:magnesium transporter
MIVFEEQLDSLVKLSDPIIGDSRVVIISTMNNPALINWLKASNFPEQLFEYIAYPEQTPLFDEFSNGNMLILKHIKLNNNSFLEFSEENIALVSIDNNIVLICKYKETAIKIDEKFTKRVKNKKASQYFELYSILDVITDSQIQTLDHVSVALENTEENILSEDGNRKETLKNLYYARRSLNRLGHIFVNEASSLNRFFVGIPTSTKKKFRFEFTDLKEHKQVLATDCKSYQDKTVSLLNLQMGLTDNRVNESMQTLASISLIFIPLTFLTSVFSMNFKNMPELEIEQGYHIVVVACVAIGVATYWWLKKQKYM